MGWPPISTRYRAWAGCSNPISPNPSRLQAFYKALRGEDTSSSPTKHSFRPDQGLFLLVTRLQLDPNGLPHVPGNLEVWKDVLMAKTDSKVDP